MCSKTNLIADNCCLYGHFWIFVPQMCVVLPLIMDRAVFEYSSDSTPTDSESSKPK